MGRINEVNFKEPERFWSKVDVSEPDKCWEWLASKRNAYGSFGVHYRTWYAHRVAWILTFGPIPQGLHCCHRCDNPLCCNPYHLFLGTDADNLADAVRKGRSIRPSRRGERSHWSQLTDREVLEIRELYTSGEWLQAELASEFGVDCASISRIVRRKQWRHI